MLVPICISSAHLAILWPSLHQSAHGKKHVFPVVYQMVWHRLFLLLVDKSYLHKIQCGQIFLQESTLYLIVHILSLLLAFDVLLCLDPLCGEHSTTRTERL